MEYEVILTEYGLEKLRDSIAEGIPFNSAKMAVGDGNGESYIPERTAEDLKNVKFKGDLVEQGKRRTTEGIPYLYFVMQIPHESGGYTIREVGLYDEEDKLLAISPYPELDKVVTSGNLTQVVSIELQLFVTEETFLKVTLVEIGDLVTKDELALELSKKQEVIQDLETIREGSDLGATSVQPSDNISTLTNDIGYALRTELGTKSVDYGNMDTTTVSNVTVKKVTGSQTVDGEDKKVWQVGFDSADFDLNNDLSCVRVHPDIKDGAAKGATALQSFTETDPIYTADKQDIVFRTELEEHHDDTKQDKLTAGTNIKINPLTNVISAEDALTEVNWGDIKGTLNDQTDLKGTLDKKQDTILDLATIRTGAAKGATALQSYEETDPIYTADKPYIAFKTDLFSKDYNELINKPDIPSKTSDLVNDNGFITTSYHDNTKQDKLTAGSNITITPELVQEVLDVSGTPYYALTELNSSSGVIYATTKPIEEVKAGERVYTYSPSSGRVTAYDRVRTNYNNRITLEDMPGKTLKAKEVLNQTIISANGFLTEVNWGDIKGSISEQLDLTSALGGKQNVIMDLAAIREGAAKSSTVEQALNQEISDRQTADSQIQESITTLTNTVNTNKEASESRDTALGERVDTLTSTIESTYATKEELTSKSETLEKSVSDLDEKLSKEIEDLGSTTGDVKTEIEGLTTEIEGLTTEIEGLTTELSTLDTKVDTTAQTINQRITEVAEEINETIEENVTALQQADTALQGQITTNTQAISGLDTRVTTNAEGLAQEILDRQNADSELQSQIDNLQSRGRFLALWDATTGLPKSTPQATSFDYNSGDYYIVDKVGETNYRPSGTKFVADEPSTVEETEEVTVNDTYYFDGSTWNLQAGSTKTVSFASLAGSPLDNTNLKNALDNKQAVITDLETIRTGAGLGATAIQTETDPIYTADKPNIALKSEIPDISGKQDKLTAGANITIDPETNTISASGSLSEVVWGGITGDITSQADLKAALDGKQSTIEDLATIRDGASKGATAIQEVKTINGESIIGEGDITIQGGSGSKVTFRKWGV